MPELTSQHLELFANLTSILAITFQDFQKICSTPNPSTVYRSLQKQEWLDKFDESKQKESNESVSYMRSELEEEFQRPIKKIKIQEHSGEVKRQRQKKKKVPKWERQGKPKPPLNAFMLFLQDSKMEIMQAKPELSPAQVSTYASALWSELTEEEKDKYRNEYKESKVKYDEVMREYHEREKLNGKIGDKALSKTVEKMKRPKMDILDQGLSSNSSYQSMSGI